MRNIFTICLLLGLSVTAASQPSIPSGYSKLRCRGEIPADFRTAYAEQVAMDVAGISREENRRTQKVRTAFYVQSNFYIRELLTGGDVLFGDTVTQYVNRVADLALASFPELRSQLRFYVTKSSTVNAFSTDKGIIFVNLGLIAQLENEAQLAYIILHEVAHYVKKHNMDLYLYADNVSRKTIDLRNQDYQARMMCISYRSKESEMEADREGLLTYYKTTNYSYRAARTVFDVMYLSYLPFDLIPFEKSFFETGFFSFPEDYRLDSLSAVNPEKYLYEESATHPDIASRLQEAETLLLPLSDEGRKKFILPEEEFNYIRNIARFETVRLRILSRNYTAAIYDAFMLLKDFPGNRYLEMSVATSLYALSKYRDVSLKAGQISYKKVQGEPQQLYYFLQKLSKKEMNVLALGWCARMYDKYPDSEFLKQAVKELAYTLSGENKMSLSFFSSLPADFVSIIENEKQDTSRSAKYGKVAGRKTKTDDSYLRYAFVDLMRKNFFIEVFSDAENENALKEKSPRESRRFRKCSEDCVEKLLIADPYYLQYDARRSGAVKYFRTDELSDKIRTIIETSAKENDIEASLLSPSAFGKDDVDKLNDYAFMKDYLSERLSHDDENLVMISPETDNMLSVMNTYGTDFMSWTGILNVRLKGGFTSTDLLLFMSIYGIPVAIYRILKPDWVAFYYHVMFDVRRSKPVIEQSRRINTRFRDDLMRLYIYDTFYQIKHTRKPKL